MVQIEGHYAVGPSGGGHLAENRQGLPRLHVHIEYTDVVQGNVARVFKDLVISAPIDDQQLHSCLLDTHMGHGEVATGTWGLPFKVKNLTDIQSDFRVFAQVLIIVLTDEPFVGLVAWLDQPQIVEAFALAIDASKHIESFLIFAASDDLLFGELPILKPHHSLPLVRHGASILLHVVGLVVHCAQLVARARTYLILGLRVEFFIEALT
jgi:hypothetical protein